MKSLFARKLLSINAILLLITSLTCHSQVSKKAPRNTLSSAEDISRHGIRLKYAPGYTVYKFSFSSAFKADFGLSVEKKLTKEFSGEISLGGTYYDLIFDEEKRMNFKPANLPPRSGAHAKAGLSFKLGARWYPKAAPLEVSGLYLGPEFLYRLYRSEQYDKSSTYFQTNNQNELRALLGWQFANKEDNILHADISIGGGLRYHKRRYLGYINPLDPINGGYEFVKAQKVYFIYTINFKLGLSFSEFFD